MPWTVNSGNFRSNVSSIFLPRRSPEGSAETIPIFNYLSTPLEEDFIDSIKV